MKIDILLSCMHKKDTSIVERSNIQTDTVVVNQCDEESVISETYVNKKGETHSIIFISTTERGLSRSRNMALRNSTADVCVIVDDDETMTDNYAEVIAAAYAENPKADVIAFNFVRADGTKKHELKRARKIGYIGALRISSIQITFRRESVAGHNIMFDEEMGAGTGNGAGEENKFLYDCLKHGLRIIEAPAVIARLNPGEPSSWFRGFDKKYFFDLGWSVRRFMGRFFATLYAFYTCVSKYRMYKKDCTFTAALCAFLKGIFKPYHSQSSSSPS